MNMREFLKIGCWSIHNLKSSTFDKTEDKHFIKETQEYDIFCLQETKCDENIYTLSTSHIIRSLYADRKNRNIQLQGEW